jgi:hypothetical protein
MIDEATYNRAAKLEIYSPTMLKEFSYLLRAREVVQQFSASKFRTLEVKQIDDYTIDACYLNTTVRFQLLLGYKDGNANGRVVCLNKYLVCDKPHYDILGEFNFDQSGRTDLGADERGNIRIMDGHADEIVVGWLNKAIEQGPQAFAQAKI